MLRKVPETRTSQCRDTVQDEATGIQKHFENNAKIICFINGSDKGDLKIRHLNVLLTSFCQGFHPSSCLSCPCFWGFGQRLGHQSHTGGTQAQAWPKGKAQVSISPLFTKDRVATLRSVTRDFFFFWGCLRIMSIELGRKCLCLLSIIINGA